MDSIAAFVKSKRKELGLTQQPLALYTGVSTKFIIELESGKPTVRMDKVLDVLKLFDCGLVVKHL